MLNAIIIDTPGVPEWPIGIDCKSIGASLRGFESLPLDHEPVQSTVHGHIPCCEATLVYDKQCLLEPK